MHLTVQERSVLSLDTQSGCQCLGLGLGVGTPEPAAEISYSLKRTVSEKPRVSKVPLLTTSANRNETWPPRVLLSHSNDGPTIHTGKLTKVHMKNEG